MPTIYIDEQAYEVPEGDNILQACLSAGIDLPYFCWHPEMGSVGACRQCALVQFRDAEDARGRVVMGCMTPVTDGARFSMKGDKATEFRENIIESLMLNHPHDCPVCAEGGECHLQDMTVMVGHRDRRYRGKKNTHNNQYLGPLINHEMNRCISCYRCTRFYNDYAGGTDFAAQGAHDHVYFGRQQEGTLESEFAGNLVEVCPTGVFTDKPLVNDYTRKWDMQSAPSICTGCAVGCNIIPSERYGKLKRVHNRFNNQVNGYFLCDRGRYGGDYVNDENRIKFAGLRTSDGRYDAIDNKQALQFMLDWCGLNTTAKSSPSTINSSLAAIGSPRASVETNYLLHQLVGAQNYSTGIAEHEAQLIKEIVDVLTNAGISTPSLRQIEDADAVLILGEDVTNTAPRMALALRQSVRNLAKSMAQGMKIALWQDEAVRVLAQDRLSPLFILSMADSRLDDVSEQTLTMPPADIARFGFAIAAQLDSSMPEVKGHDKATQKHIQQIANSLNNASKPLIVSGTGCQSASVIQAAAAIATALNNESSTLSYCVPEANSLGVALMHDEEHPSLTELCQRASDGQIETLIIAENDLYRRAPKHQIDQLLADVENIIVLDSIDTPTLSKSTLALPAATTFESEGTLISNEGRAQRHYPVFQPADHRQATWRWLRELGQTLNTTGFDEFNHFDDVTAACVVQFPSLAGILQASPSGQFLNRGVKIPRQTHRYSGRTAMLANISMHEPKQPVDDDSPFSYSMEGSNAEQPGALIPYVWSPGWNSNQSVHKFQSEAGGALIGGTPGQRLIEAISPANSPINPPSNKLQNSSTQNLQAPGPFTVKADQWQLLPLYRIFGSEELSVRSPAIMELCEPAFIQLRPQDATQLQVNQGDELIATSANIEHLFTVQLNPSIPPGCAGYSVGLPGAGWLAAETNVTLHKPTKQTSGGPSV